MIRNNNLFDNEFPLRTSLWLIRGIFCLSLGLLLTSGCKLPDKDKDQLTGELSDTNPAAPDFDLQGSDVEAVALADSVMMAVGGRRAWDQTRILHWNFFDLRKILWNKETGKVRIFTKDAGLEILLDLEEMEGEVIRNGTFLTHPDSLEKYLDLGRRIWINDSYWLVMPFKLKDSGVTLSYLGRDTLADGSPTSVVRLTFDDVGVTPLNKYHIWIGNEDHLVRKWAYFRNFEDEEPRLTSPWEDYRWYGEILLSGDRGADRQITEIAVIDSLPEGVFQSLKNSYWE